MGGTGLCSVQRKGACMGEAIQHAFPRGYASHGLPVIFLIQEESGLLAIDIIHLIPDAVFCDLSFTGELPRNPIC